MNIKIVNDMFMKKIMRYLLLFFVIFSFADVYAQKEDVTIIFESDVHGATEGYGVIARLRDSLSATNNHVILVSCGDFSSGDYLSGRSKGKSIVNIMNNVGYDVVVPGNHEFDWGVERMIRNKRSLQAQMVCCNFFKNDSLLLPSYYMVSRGSIKVAFIGVVTPTTKEIAAPLDFKNAEGKYKILGGNALVSQVQKNIDEVRAKGADYVVLLCHLGDDDGKPDSATTRLINSITGVTAVINGHDHKLVDAIVRDAANMPVLHVATNNSFDVIGILSIKENDNISVNFLPVFELRRKGLVNSEIDSLVNQEKMKMRGDSIVGYSLVNLKTIGPVRNLSRIMETNCGDYVADAFLHEAKKIMKKTRVAIVNAGSIRCDIDSGIVTEELLFNVVPFPNRMCLVELTGKEIDDMLEKMVASWPPKSPLDKGSGGFPQVSGIRFVLDSLAANGEKVKMLQVYGGFGWRYVVPWKKYLVVTNDFILYGGDGISIKPSCIINTDKWMYEGVVRQYLLDSEKKIGTKYKSVDKRIVLAGNGSERFHVSIWYVVLFVAIALAITVFMVRLLAVMRAKNTHSVIKVCFVVVCVGIVVVSYYYLCFPIMR